MARIINAILIADRPKHPLLFSLAGQTRSEAPAVFKGHPQTFSLPQGQMKPLGCLNVPAYGTNEPVTS